ncbi:SH3 domain-containing protein [Gemmobacter denitrificans]|uniref:SH3 domain-containing protein n=1 Tax=Gemmobacter denitrificans TaxID=3123040 RepID=A0ABU8BR49_9RHOB
MGFIALPGRGLALALLIGLGPGMAGAQTAPDPATGADLPPGTDTTADASAPRDPSRGQVTSLPLPRFVTLKTDEGNARRGPGLSHRIDWVFKRAGMPLRVTAEYENWRRVEDQEGLGGWVHYSLLSGVRSVLVQAELAEFRAAPDSTADVVLRAERGVIARVIACTPDWCRLNVQGEKGWVSKAALWGVEAGEVID